MSDFTDKTVIVTGGSRGIGRAVVAAFAAAGARVWFTYVKNDQAANELAAASGCTAVRCSQNDAAAIVKTVDDVAAAAGRVDVLVNNAGIVSDQFLMLMPEEDWNKVVDTNLNGAMRWAKAVSRPMISAHRGSIVNVASVAGMVGIGGQTNYAASKGAIIAFSRALAAELGPKGIRVNTVVPGFIDTDMTAKMPRDIKRSNLDRILLKRFGRAQEIAETVLFLASDRASYVTGQTLVADGGLTATVA